MIYTDYDTETCMMGSEGYISGYDLDVEDIKIKYFQVLWKFIYLNSRYFAPIVIRIRTGKIHKFIMCMIPVELNIVKLP